MVIDTTLPKVEFPQCDQDSCAFACLSSALYYMNYNDVALRVDNFKHEYMKDCYNRLYNKMLNQINTSIRIKENKRFTRKYCMKKIDDPNLFDLMKEATDQQNQHTLYHVVLEGKDGSKNHSSCIVNQLIFDGNFSHALKLTVENLNHCCQSEFTKIVQGYMWIPTTKQIDQISKNIHTYRLD
jgi:hypothetical protein